MYSSDDHTFVFFLRNLVESLLPLFVYPRTYLYPWIKPKAQYMILGPCPYNYFRRVY